MNVPQQVAAAARRMLQSARRIAILTGAGISAESGVPTFRDADGLWRNYRAAELATPEAFARDPKTVWEWYDWRRQKVAEASPNAGHLALARLLQQRQGVTLITQNVDGLHDLAYQDLAQHDLAQQQIGAGDFPALLKLHGDLWTLRCTGCNTERTDRRAPLPLLPPVCLTCGAMERPGVVWFGEALPMDTLMAADQAARQADLFLVVGTSAVVYPAAGLVPIAKQAGAQVIEINPGETGVTDLVDLIWRAPAAQALPLLLHPLLH